MVNDALDQFKNENLFSKKTAEGRKVIKPKTPKFNMTPKINKEHKPGRPVNNIINCHTSEILRFVDHHLQPLVKEIPSCKKNTINFVNKMNNFKDMKISFLVTMDVKALHTNIPNTKKTVATVITTFFIRILTRNSFIFNSKFYLQIKGCVMGTICAPTYKKYIRVQKEIHLSSH